MVKKTEQKIIEILKKIYKYPKDAENSFMLWFDNRKRLAFFSALIIGIITHITFLTEMVMSQDGLWNSISYSQPGLWEITLGRWGITFADKIVNYLAIPSVVGIVSILLITFSAVLIVDLLELKNKISIFLVSAALVVSPALTGTLMYIYTSVAYCLAFLLSVFVVYLIFKSNNKIMYWIIAIAIFVFSLGIYQGYIGVIIGLAIIKLIRDLFDNEKELKHFFIYCIVLLIIIILGGLIYSNITQKVLQNNGLDKGNYKGLESISISNTINHLGNSIKNAYQDFYDFYFTDNIIKNENFCRNDFYKFFFISVLANELILIAALKIWKKPLRLFLIIIMNALLPIGFNAVTLLATETTTYILTSAPLILIIPFTTMICEMSEKKETFIFNWISIISMFIIIFTYYMSANASYITIKLKYNQIYSNSIRILNRIETFEGYTKDMPIMIAGIINKEEFGAIQNVKDYTLGDFFDYEVFHGIYIGRKENWIKFLNIFMGYTINTCTANQYTEIANSTEFKKMKIFPDKDSIKIINDVIVVKLLENPEIP